MRRLLQLAKDHIIFIWYGQISGWADYRLWSGGLLSANSNSRKGIVRNQAGRINQQRTGSD